METKYTRDSEWLRFESEDVIAVGITDYAQESLGDLVFVELPVVGDKKNRGDEVVVIESVKAASGIKMPAAGEIIEVNTALVDDPSLINTDAMGAGWFFKMKVDKLDELDDLLDEAGYTAFIAK